MEKYNLGKMEQRFADLIWENEPIASGVLAKLCEAEFQWKKTTTYTMLKRLCIREIFQNKGGAVTSIMKKEEFHAMQGKEFINVSFDGSLPNFLVAFSKHNKLSKTEVEQIKLMIDSHEEV